MPEGTYVPVLVITGDLSPTTKQRALSAGKDFLGKPFDPLEVVLRIKNLLEARSLYVELQRQNEVLEESRAAPLRAGGRAARDSRAPGPDGGVPRRRHDAAQRVGAISARIAEALGLPDDLVKTARGAAARHRQDRRPRQHPAEAGQADAGRIRRHQDAHGHRRASCRAAPPAAADGRADRAHPYERWDGHGYMGGLRGEEIRSSAGSSPSPTCSTP